MGGHVVAVAAGGALGGVLRYASLELFAAGPQAAMWLVLVENLTGAFLLGLLIAALASLELSVDLRPFLATGLLGSFTTFSNSTLDVYLLQASGSLGTAVLYSLASLCFGLTAALLGVASGRALVSVVRRSAR